jgi:hypothetical protein
LQWRSDELIMFASAYRATSTTNPPTTTGVDPTSLDNVTTDPTPLTAAAMFPPTITDQLRSLFALSANTMMPCVTPSMTSNIKTR